MAEGLQGMFRLFLLPEAHPNAWQLKLTKLNGNGKVERPSTSPPSNGEEIVVDNHTARVLVNRETRLIDACIAPTLPGWAALLIPIMSILQTGRVFAMHSAAFVDKKGRGFVFPGSHASGKTTVTFTALQHGRTIVTDDILLLRREGQDVHFLPLLSVLSLEEGKPIKTLFHVLDHYPREVFQPAINPRFIMFPKITDQARTTVEAISTREELLNQLLTYSLLAEAKPLLSEQLGLLWQLARKASAYRLFLGRDHRASPEILHELLDQLEVVEK